MEIKGRIKVKTYISGTISGTDTKGKLKVTNYVEGALCVDNTIRKVVEEIEGE